MYIHSIWPKKETNCPFKKYMSDVVCSFFNSGRRKEFNRCAFLTVKYHNPENLVFQHLPVKEKVKNPYKNNRLGENKKMRNSIIIDILTSVDIVEIDICGGVFWRCLKGFSVIAYSIILIQNLFLIYLKKEIFSNHKEKIYFKTY